MSTSINVDNIESNPHCPHGPMVVLVSKPSITSPNEVYACTFSRKPNDCPFSFSVKKTLSKNKLLALSEARRSLAPVKSHKESIEILKRFRSTKLKQRRFCHSCFAFVFPDEISLHAGHDISGNISDEALSRPSFFVIAKTLDKQEAQYWFDNNSKEFLISLAGLFDANSVVCLGTPTLYEVFRANGVQGMLLDIDKRYMLFYDEQEFGWFNMFNFYPMSDESICIEVLKRLLTQPKVCIFIDPPFGAMLELLAYLISKLRSFSTGEIFLFLALPYFMEPKVTEFLPDFRMADYVLHYDNHSKMKSHKSSPVRIFTNAPLSMIRLPSKEGYYYCNFCDCWRHPNNSHCNVCLTCPSKNGKPYKHCNKCNKCVKSSWEHCAHCQRCFLAPHKCNGKAFLKRRSENKIRRKKKIRKL